jgi:dienelactone hydrolase
LPVAVRDAAISGAGMRYWLGLIAACVFATTAQAAPPLEAYGRLPAIEGVWLSPSGDRFAIIGKDKVARRLFVRLADGQVEYVVNLGAAEISGVHWVGEDHLMVFNRTTVGAKAASIPLQVWNVGLNINIKTQATSIIFKDSNSVLDAVFGWMGARKVDGRWYDYVAGVPYDKIRNMPDTGVAYPDLFRVDVETGAYQSIAKAGPGRAIWVLAADGSVAGHSSYDVRGKQQSIYLGPGEGHPVLTRQVGEDQLRLTGGGRTPNSIVVSDRSSGKALVLEFRPEGPPDGAVLFPGDDSAVPFHSFESGTLLGRVLGNGDGVEFSDPILQRRLVAAIKAFPNLHAKLVQYSPNLDKMVFYIQGTTDSGSYWLVDVPAKSARSIGDARPDLPSNELGSVRAFSYTATDGTPLDGVLTLPPKSIGKGLALIILPNQAPDAFKAEPSFDARAQAFASRGYAVFAVNPRGVLGYGETFRRLGDGQVGKAVQTDISSGISALAAEGVIDPKRVCIVGQSYGGYVALAGVTLQQGIYRCSVAISGLSDLTRFAAGNKQASGSDARRERELNAKMGSVSGEQLDTISPARLADKADAPILLIHGALDAEIPVEQSRLMERALNKAGKPVNLIILPKEDHTLVAEATAQKLLADVVAFVEKYNPAN